MRRKATFAALVAVLLLPFLSQAQTYTEADRNRIRLFVTSTIGFSPEIMPQYTREASLCETYIKRILAQHIADEVAGEQQGAPKLTQEQRQAMLRLDLYNNLYEKQAILGNGYLRALFDVCAQRRAADIKILAAAAREAARGN